jgi:Lrp/AsnC family transcriptional regulator, regulator for asnA, asnC and gidA
MKVAYPDTDSGQMVTYLADISKVDAKIIRILFADSRTSFTSIAKECNLTVAAVRMRYLRLREEGIITGEKMLVNPHYLGYRHIVDLGITTEIEKEREIAKFIESKPYISQVIGPLDKFNFYGKVALQDLSKLQEIIEDLKQNPDTKNVQAFIWTQAIHVEYPLNLVLRHDEQEKRKNLVPEDNRNLFLQHQIDESDRKIALILSQNSRTPFKKIAKDLGLTTKKVVQKYDRLKGKLLTLSTITVDLKKLGYNALANIYIKASSGSKLSNIHFQLLEIPNVIVIIRLIGDYDMYIAVVLEDFDKMFEVKEKIRKINGIETTNTMLTALPPSWPLNLFPSLLEGESMPKYWEET